MNEGGKLDRSQKNWLTEQVNNNSYSRTAIPLFGWMFPFEDDLKKYVVKQYGHCQEYCAVDKTALRNYIGSGINYIVEVK